MSNTKICTKCGRELPIERFSKDKHHKDGLKSQCKDCDRQYIIRNIEYFKKYRKNNAESIKQYLKQWRKDNPEYEKKYRETLEGYCRNIRRGNIRRDKEQGYINNELPSNYPTIEDYMELLQQTDHYDGKQYHFSEMGLDRIDNSKPHTLDNVVPCTTEHNIQRNTKSYEEFKALFCNT